jgi:hypothetical protein
MQHPPSFEFRKGNLCILISTGPDWKHFSKTWLRVGLQTSHIKSAGDLNTLDIGAQEVMLFSSG